MSKESQVAAISVDQIAESVTSGVLRAIDARKVAGGDRIGGLDIHIAGGRFEFFVGSGVLHQGGGTGPIGPGGVK